MDNSNKIINCFWHGKLNETSLISMHSFHAQQHSVYLWCYNHPKNIPAFIVVKDASEIVPKDVFLKWFPQNDNSDYRMTRLPTFACYFRYKLLYEKGGWWSDVDIFCLKPFNFSSKHIFCEQPIDPENINKLFLITNAIFKTPKHSLLLSNLLKEIEPKAVKAEIPEWGVWGPRMFTKYILELAFDYDLQKKVFMPFPPGKHGIAKQYLDKNVVIPNWAYSLHMFNRYTMDLVAKPESLYDIIRQKHLSNIGKLL